MWIRPNSKPLRLQAIQFHAENIRNIESPDKVYPSKIKLDAQVFDSGRLTVEGKADFMAEPHLGVDADVTLAHVVLKDLLPLAGRMSLQVREGTLDAKGHVEYSPTVQQVELRGTHGGWIAWRLRASGQISGKNTNVPHKRSNPCGARSAGSLRLTLRVGAGENHQ